MVEIPAPMLASHGRPTGSLVGWTAEFKADGFRCQVAVLGGRRVVRTRGGHDIADRLPELAYLSELGVDLILDGELIAGAGRPADFSQVIGSVSSTRGDRAQLSMMAFDLLMLDGRTLVDRPHSDRRTLLERVHELGDGSLSIVPSYPGTDLDDLLVACEHLDLEGVVLKRSASRYKPGRSQDWRKIKTALWRTMHLPARQRPFGPSSQASVQSSRGAVSTGGSGGWVS